MNSVTLPNVFKSATKIENKDLKKEILAVRYTKHVAKDITNVEDFLDNIYFYKDNDFIVVIDVEQMVIIISQESKGINEVFTIPENLPYDEQEEVFMNYIYLIYYSITKDV